jgi:Histidine kinase-, DNA gyrase B-, and HSP90-like ATPase
MKFTTEKSPTTASGMQESRAFHFEFNETMFKMLSSTTYSDPIRAVIRELACNSSDAHEVAGTQDKPFEIHLPTTHEPEFMIRDFGVGMDAKEIDDLFTMYGGSNKRNDNRTIGALGIGSKSPYAYTQMYNIITTKNGVTRTYVAHVQDGMPRLTPDKVYETPDAPNGVTVQFAVKEKDIWEFQNKAAIALEFFEPQPKINVSGFNPHKQSYVLKGDSWGLRKEARTAAHGYSCRAIMGKVQYQIGGIDESRTTSLQRKILDMPIDMHFPLGALEFATSRETLQLSEKTVTAVLAMCDRIVEEAIQTVKDKINACKDIWEAQILLFSVLNQTNNSYAGNGMSSLIREALEKGKLYGQYKNFNLSEQKAVINMLSYSHINVTKYEHNSRASKRCKKEPWIMVDPKTLREDKAKAKATGDPLVISRNRYEINVKPDVLFVINDTKLPGDKYIHYFIQESNNKREVYLIHKPKSAPDTDLAATVKNAKKLLANIGNPPVKLMSEFVTEYAPIFAARRTTGTTPKTRQIAVMVDHIGHRRSSNQTGWGKAWRSPSEEEIAAPGKKYYVVIEKLAAVDTGFDDAWDLQEFVNHVSATHRFGIKPGVPLYGIKRNHKALKDNNGEWVELMSHVFDRVAEIMTPQKTMALSLYLTPFNDDCADLLSHLASKQPLTNSPAQMFAVALAEAKSAKMDNWSAFKTVLNFCANRGRYAEGATLDFNAKWQEVKALYPMLQFVGGYSARANMTTLVNYIRQVDEQNSREAACASAASN